MIRWGGDSKVRCDDDQVGGDSMGRCDVKVGGDSK